MKLELVEITNHIKYGDYFEIRKDGTCEKTFFYGEPAYHSREKVLENATEKYNRIKQGSLEEEKIILSEEI